MYKNLCEFKKVCFSKGFQILESSLIITRFGYFSDLSFTFYKITRNIWDWGKMRLQCNKIMMYLILLERS
jgi:hypothetical protein